jgi:heat shock protein HslJ
MNITLRGGRMAAAFLWIGMLLAPPAAADTSVYERLPGTSWALVEWPGARGAMPRGATIAFSREGGVSGRGVCNHYMGRFDVAGARIKLEIGAWTKMHCGRETARDRNFHDDLLRIARLDIVADGTLVAYDDKSALLFRFRRAPAGG